MSATTLFLFCFSSLPLSFRRLRLYKHGRSSVSSVLTVHFPSNAFTAVLQRTTPIMPTSDHAQSTKDFRYTHTHTQTTRHTLVLQWFHSDASLRLKIRPLILQLQTSPAGPRTVCVWVCGFVCVCARAQDRDSEAFLPLFLSWCAVLCPCDTLWSKPGDPTEEDTRPFAPMFVFLSLWGLPVLIILLSDEFSYLNQKSSHYHKSYQIWCP